MNVVTLDPDRAPWERQPKEPARSYQAFISFRDMGPDRSLTRLATEMGSSEGRFRGPAKKWLWNDRVGAWVDFVQRQRDQEQIKAERAAVNEMIARHTKMAVSVTRFLTVELAKFMHANGSAGNDPDLTANPIVSFDTLRKGMEFSFKAEREVRGVPNYGWREVEDDIALEEEKGPHIDFVVAKAREARLRHAERKQITSGAKVEREVTDGLPTLTPQDFQKRMDWSELDDDEE